MDCNSYFKARADWRPHIGALLIKAVVQILD
jgi:hypothetical protein